MQYWRIRVEPENLKKIAPHPKCQSNPTGTPAYTIYAASSPKPWPPLDMSLTHFRILVGHAGGFSLCARSPPRWQTWLVDTLAEPFPSVVWQAVLPCRLRSLAVGQQRERHKGRGVLKVEAEARLPPALPDEAGQPGWRVGGYPGPLFLHRHLHYYLHAPRARLNFSFLVQYNSKFQFETRLLVFRGSSRPASHRMGKGAPWARWLGNGVQYGRAGWGRGARASLRQEAEMQRGGGMHSTWKKW